MGSVKDLKVLRYPTANAEGVGNFIFSDRYSVFDWGEMPDHILEKGKAICIATAYFFEKLEEFGIKTHYIGLVEDGKAKKLNELKEPSNILQVKLVRVIKPEIRNNSYDYSVYKKEKANFLIPLEIIYRNSLPAGSSVFKRLESGILKLEDIGLEDIPSPGQILEKPIFDVSTKLEVIDRYVSWEEAKEICNLSDYELEEIKKIVSFVNDIITNITKNIGLFNEDGKIEFAFDEERNIILIDALGTLDECRFTYNGLPVSKEVARIYYRKTSWYRDIEDAKRQDKINWKSLVKSNPPSLPQELAQAISLIYKAYANELTQRKWFDAPPMKEILSIINNFVK